MRRISPHLLSLFVLLLAILLSIAIGSVFIPPADLWRVLTGQPPQTVTRAAVIVLTLRLPRTALILLAGAALGASGAAYQGVFRNPLADPYLIGTASGAGLGAVLAMSVNWPYTTAGLLAIPAAAFVGALAAVFLVYLLARVGKTVPTTNLILAGVAFSAFATGLTAFLMLQSTGELRRAIAWLLGGSTFTGWGPVLVILPFLVIGLGGLLLAGHSLNVLQFGDDQARQMGLPVGRARTLILLAASLATASAVAFSGIIGFIGLIIPHVMRLWFGADYRRLLPLAMIGGAAALLLADVLARVVMAPQELPVGVVTALAGAPFFVWVLRRAKNQGYW
ncbi:MAG: iron complex transport system permease protein [Anaerolineaceae bacterium]|nr:MAG: iron complex transport system permease protein [Anaerolineaceae bacterium]